MENISILRTIFKGQSLSKSQGQIKDSQQNLKDQSENELVYFRTGKFFSLFKWIHLLDMHLEIISHIP